MVDPKIIRKYRLRQNMSQQDLADALGVSRQAISQFERGIATPSRATLNRMALVFNADVAAQKVSQKQLANIFYFLMEVACISAMLLCLLLL